MAEPGRAILEAVGIDIDDPVNLVTVSTKMHWHMQRNRGRFSVLTEKQRMTYNEPGDATCREQQEQWETAEFIM